MRKILEHPWTQNVLALLALIASIIGIVTQSRSTASSSTGTNGSNAYWIAALFVFFGIASVGILISRIVQTKKKREQTVIDKLCSLQNAYLLNPNFVTSQQHGKDSREGSLGLGGKAEILTNSLQYDLFYTDEIADNIIKGARYIYLLPIDTSLLGDLANFISKISDSISRKGQSVDTLESLRRNNLEFHFFDGDISCLYNFAIFQQPAENNQPYFRQDWWYINPTNDCPHSYMLTYEINERRDQNTLDTVYAKLKRFSIKKDGHEIFANRKKLQKYIIGGK